MKTVIVTGASSGIGQEIARVFSNNNWQVVLLARNSQKLKQLATELPHCIPLVCDLTQPDQIQNIKDQLGAISVDALINNAGVFEFRSFDQDDDEIWDKHFYANMMSAVRLTRYLWKDLIDSKGHILNISSTLGVRPIAGTSAYSALKAAMNNWTLSLAIEGAAYGVKANAICPGIIDTPIHSYFPPQTEEDKNYYDQAQKAQPLGRTGQPKDIAPMAFQLCQTSSQWITGQIVNIDGGILLNS